MKISIGPRWMPVSFLLLCALLFALPASAANSLFLATSGTSTPAGEITVAPGQPLTLDLRMDFLDTTVGGGVALVVDPALLRVDGVTFDPALGDTPKLRCPSSSGDTPLAGCPGSANLVTFGGLTGIAGDRRVASVQLTGLANGTTHPGLSQVNAFSDATGRPLAVTFVPEPAVSTLLPAGLGMLFLLWKSRMDRASGAIL